MNFRTRTWVLASLCLLSTVGCDQDPFRLSDRTILGNYYLHQSEWGSYYLCHEEFDCGGYGVLEGAVGSLGWNEQYIVVWQEESSGSPGWMIIDVEAESIVGPLTDDQLELYDPTLEVGVMAAADAWMKLGRPDA